MSIRCIPQNLWTILGFDQCPFQETIRKQITWFQPEFRHFRLCTQHTDTSHDFGDILRFLDGIVKNNGVRLRTRLRLPVSSTWQYTYRMMHGMSWGFNGAKKDLMKTCIMEIYWRFNHPILDQRLIPGYFILLHIGTKGLVDSNDFCSFNQNLADLNVCLRRAMKPKSDTWISGDICHLVYFCLQEHTLGRMFWRLSMLSQFRNHKTSCLVSKNVVFFEVSCE